MKKLWITYKAIIYGNCTVPAIPQSSIYYWKNQLFAITVMFLLPMSIIVLVPGIFMAYKFSLTGMLLSDFVTVATILAVAFMPGISVFARKLLFNGALYTTSVVMLHYLGSNGPGLLYLFAITIFVLVSLDQLYGYLTLMLNTLICIYFGIALYYGFASSILLKEYQLDSWFAVSSNLVFLSGIAVFLIPTLFNGLQSAFKQQEQLKDKLEDSIENLNSKNKELEQFAYTVSHDLKEPLRMVRSFMELLKNKYGKILDNKAHEYIHYAVEGAERMGDNIDDLLEYSRIGRKYTTIEQTDLNSLVDGILKNLTSDIEESQAQISIADLPTMHLVPVSIKILFQNLLTNALKYHPEGQRPVITIEAEEKNNCWQFAVTDNGIGIDAKYHEQVFAVFNRLHMRDEFPGSGMGLAISKKIVEQHDGQIWIESNKEQGSTFKFTICKILPGKKK
ncbi:sensor histidine kinase [Fodinibius sp. AD559]|uniref:sensor histidine kinase n=1 Tax=Fodinibius sp. AD559 TaxID=3424179 RepID=UPI004046AEF9